MKTKFQTKEEALAARKWYHIDATDLVVGRLASQIAATLRGKGNVSFTPHNDCGDFVVVTNVDKIRFTGTKPTTKHYYHHTGYIGGMKEERADKMLARKPELVLQRAVWGMLPKTSLGRAQLTKLKMYRGSEHPHSAQQPETLTLGK